MNFKGIAVERKLIRFLDLYERILVLEPYRDFVVNVFSLFLYFYLSTSDRMHSQVRTWTKNVDIFEKDFVVVPINERCVRRRKRKTELE